MHIHMLRNTCVQASHDCIQIRSRTSCSDSGEVPSAGPPKSLYRGESAWSVWGPNPPDKLEIEEEGEGKVPQLQKGIRRQPEFLEAPDILGACAAAAAAAAALAALLLSEAACTRLTNLVDLVCSFV